MDLSNYPALQPWINDAGNKVELVPFDESLPSEKITHAYAISFLNQEACIIPRRGNGMWWLPGGTIEQGETWRETLKRELMEELGVRIQTYEPFIAYYAKDKYRIVSWAVVEPMVKAVDPDGDVGIVEIRVINPKELTQFYKTDLLELYLLATELYRQASSD